MKIAHLKVIAVPLLGLCGLVLGVILVLKAALGYTQNLLSLEKESQHNEAILIQKRDTLTHLGNDVLSQTGLAAAALPGENPAFAVLAQIRQLATENATALSQFVLEENQVGTRSVATVNLSFLLEGELMSILNFVNSFKITLPLNNITEVNLEIKGTQAKAVFKATAYWSPLPERIPSPVEQVTELTPEDFELLAKLGGYRYSTVMNALPNLPSAVTNPFG